MIPLQRLDELLSPHPITPVTREELRELVRQYRNHHPEMFMDGFEPEIITTKGTK